MKGLTLSEQGAKRAYVLDGILEERWTVAEGASLVELGERTCGEC